MTVLSGVAVEVLLCLLGDVIDSCVLVFGCHVYFAFLFFVTFSFAWVGIYK